MEGETPQARIVVGVDGSEPSKRALRWAIDEATLRHATVTVVTAWHVPPYAYGAPGFGPIVAAPPTSSTREAAEDAANAAAEEARRAGIESDVIVSEAQAAHTLVETAREASLLVVGSRGHGGFTGLLLGSVGQQCAHHASCPVVIVR